MKWINRDNLILLFALISFLSFSCSKKNHQEVEVYYNDFEQKTLEGITGGEIFNYNGSYVLGNYNNGGFKLLIKDLPKHELVTISFDLLIHDSWDGNKRGIDGPDIWQMYVDNESYINTSFSNDACYNVGEAQCTAQSYPNNYPKNTNQPRKGAFKIGLPAVCHPTGSTSLYKITKTINHSKDKLTLECIDQLVQKNAENALCDESWSVDNIKISTITLK